MLKEVEITNFQSHQYSLLEFSPGLNAIVGMSDQGKSAIIRALTWCILNDPSGLDFRSHFAGKELTGVTIGLTNERWVCRERNDTLNRYTIDNIKDPLGAFGQGSVKEVLDVFNFSNFALRGQYDQYFLLQSPPGEVSRFLNDLTGLGISDEIIKKINSIVHKSKGEIDNANGQIEILENEIKEYSYLDQLEIEIDKLEKLLNERRNAREERRLILDYSQKIEEADQLINEWTEWLEIEKDIQLLIKQTQDINILLKEKEQLANIIDRLGLTDRDIKEFDEEVKDHQQALQLQQEIRDIVHEKDNFRILKECIERLGDFETDIFSSNLRLKELKEEKDQYGIICQNCGARVEL